MKQSTMNSQELPAHVHETLPWLILNVLQHYSPFISKNLTRKSVIHELTKPATSNRNQLTWSYNDKRGVCASD